MPLSKRWCAECGADMKIVGHGKWSPYFCPPCDEERVERVTKGFEEIAKSMGLKVPWEAEENANDCSTAKALRIVP